MISAAEHEWGQVVEIVQVDQEQWITIWLFADKSTRLYRAEGDSQIDPGALVVIESNERGQTLLLEVDRNQLPEGAELVAHLPKSRRYANGAKRQRDSTVGVVAVGK